MEDFVPYELLCKLREKGYKCKDKRFEGHIYDVLKWLREEKKIEVVVLGQNYIEGPYFADVFTKDGLMNKAEPYPKYELAAIAEIEYVIDKLI